MVTGLLLFCRDNGRRVLSTRRPSWICSEPGARSPGWLHPTSVSDRNRPKESSARVISPTDLLGEVIASRKSSRSDVGHPNARVGLVAPVHADQVRRERL